MSGFQVVIEGCLYCTPEDVVEEFAKLRAEMYRLEELIDEKNCELATTRTALARAYEELRQIGQLGSAAGS